MKPNPLENLPARTGHHSTGNRRVTDTPGHGWIVALVAAAVVVAGLLASALL
jgi:hypothetical protein